MRELDGKKGTFLEIYQLYLRKMIYKNEKRTALIAMGKDGLHIKTVFSSIKRMFG
jgi:hypothetical protein